MPSMPLSEVKARQERADRFEAKRLAREAHRPAQLERGKRMGHEGHRFERFNLQIRQETHAESYIEGNQNVETYEDIMAEIKKAIEIVGDTTTMTIKIVDRDSPYYVAPKFS